MGSPSPKVEVVQVMSLSPGDYLVRFSEPIEATVPEIEAGWTIQFQVGPDEAIEWLEQTDPTIIRAGTASLEIPLTLTIGGQPVYVSSLSGHPFALGSVGIEF